MIFAILATLCTIGIFLIMVMSRDFHFSGVAVFLLLLILSVCEWSLLLSKGLP